MRILSKGKDLARVVDGKKMFATHECLYGNSFRIWVLRGERENRNIALEMIPMFPHKLPLRFYGIHSFPMS